MEEKSKGHGHRKCKLTYEQSEHNSGGNLKMLCVSKSRGRKKKTQVKDFIASECVLEEEVCHDLAEGAQTQ